MHNAAAAAEQATKWTQVCVKEMTTVKVELFSTVVLQCRIIAIANMTKHIDSFK